MLGSAPAPASRAHKKRKTPSKPEPPAAKHHKPRPAGILTARAPPGHNRVNDKPRIITTMRDLFQSHSARHAQIILNVRTTRTPSAWPAQVRERRTTRGKRSVNLYRLTIECNSIMSAATRQDRIVDKRQISIKQISFLKTDL